MARCVRYFLLLWVAARGQVFRLPTSAACQDSKSGPDQISVIHWEIFQELFTEKGSASHTTSPGWRWGRTGSGPGRRPGTTAGTSAWTPSASAPGQRMTG